MHFPAFENFRQSCSPSFQTDSTELGDEISFILQNYLSEGKKIVTAFVRLTFVVAGVIRSRRRQRAHLAWLITAMHKDHFELQGHAVISIYIKNGLNFCAFIMIEDEPLKWKIFCQKQREKKLVP